MFTLESFIVFCEYALMLMSAKHSKKVRTGASLPLCYIIWEPTVLIAESFGSNFLSHSFVDVQLYLRDLLEASLVKYPHSFTT